MQTIDTAKMSEAEVRAYYHATAPWEDLWFWAGHLVERYPELHADLLNLAAESFTPAGKVRNRSAFYRAFTAIQDRWRRQSGGYGSEGR